MSKSLKLLAFDDADLLVISATTQDSVLRVGDIESAPSIGRLVLPVNRFAWEGPVSRKWLRKRYERRQAVLDIARVRRVRSEGFSRDDKDRVLSLLAISFERQDEDAPEGTITLTFADDAALFVDVETVEVRLTDLASRWQASGTPRHGVAAS